MGSASSKTARATTRRYPQQKLQTSPSPGDRILRKRTEASPREDGPEDVHAFPNGFSQRLNQMGVVQPNPTYSPSSTVLRQQSASDHGNLATFGDRLKATHRREPLLSTFASRHQLQKQAEAEYETSRPAVDKRFRFMDMRQLLDALRLRENNVAQASIEQRLGLNPGLLTKLGRPGILSHVSTPSKDQI